MVGQQPHQTPPNLGLDEVVEKNGTKSSEKIVPISTEVPSYEGTGSNQGKFELKIDRKTNTDRNKSKSSADHAETSKTRLPNPSDQPTLTLTNKPNCDQTNTTKTSNPNLKARIWYINHLSKSNDIEVSKRG